MDPKLYSYVVMVKLRAPLFSGAAVGTVGGIISFSRHHGMNTGQKKPDHKDQDTIDQEKQREAFKAASDAWDALNLTPLDLMAWHTLAKLRKEKIGGRQMFMKLYVIHYLKGQPWVSFRNMRVTYLGATSLQFIVEVRNIHLPLVAERTGSRLAGDIHIELTPAGGWDYQGHFGRMQRNHAFYFWASYTATETAYGRSGCYYIKTKIV